MGVVSSRTEPVGLSLPPVGKGVGETSGSGRRTLHPQSWVERVSSPSRGIVPRSLGGGSKGVG